MICVQKLPLFDKLTVRYEPKAWKNPNVMLWFGLCCVVLCKWCVMLAVYYVYGVLCMSCVMHVVSY